METPDLTSPDFWSDAGIHIMLAPDRADEAAGLMEFVKDDLGATGWCFFQTSGSEGKRKWVGLTKESLLISARAVNAHYEITNRDHWLLALPLHHVGGFGVLARAFVSGGPVTRLNTKWDAAAFVQKCVEVGATLASLVPTQVFDLVAAKLAAPKSMRVVLVGGGALSAEIKGAALQLGWPLCRTYGMTETASQVASQTTRPHDEMTVLPIWDVSTDAEDVLTVRGTALAQGHAVFESGKWRWEPIDAVQGLRTRDRVQVWQHGARRLLRFLGREAHTVKILGELVALDPIQARIEALRLELGIHKGDVVICDMPDERKEARLVLAISSVRKADAERLCVALNSALRPFEQVEQLHWLPVMPRSELGKVLLPQVRSRITSEGV